MTTGALALDLLAALVLEDGRRWGDAAVAEQWDDARAVLNPAGEPYHFLTRARGFAKTSDLAGIAVAAMLAHLLVDSVAGYAARTPELGSALRSVDAYKVGAANGSVLEVLAV